MTGRKSDRYFPGEFATMAVEGWEGRTCCVLRERTKNKWSYLVAVMDSDMVVKVEVRGDQLRKLK